MKPVPSVVLFLLLLVSHSSLSARIARQAEDLDEENNEVPQEEDFDPDEDSEEDDDDAFSFRFSWNPFQNFPDIFKQMRDNMNWIYSNLFNQTSDLPQVYKNVSSEIVTIGGSKFNVSRTIIKKADNDSQVIISSVSMDPVNKKKK